MKIDVITLFPELFAGPLATGLVGKAIAGGAAHVDFTDPRTFTTDAHRTVDDTPYGGGAGMVMKVEPLVAAIRAVRAKGAGPVVMMSPQGRPLAQKDLSRWAAGGHLALLAGRYEGFDERIRDFVDDEISLGDFVLTGGEYAALTIIDGVVRLLPGTLGNADSSEHDSFAAGLLEHPQYTRPPSFEGRDVPDVLTSGHHERIEAWRHAEALRRTRARRPDLFVARGVSQDERRMLRRDGVGLEDPFPGAPADAGPAVAFTGARSSEALVALARLAAAYELSRLIWVGGDPDQVAALPAIEVDVPDERPRRQRRGPAPRARLVTSRRIEVVPTWAAIGAPLYGSSSAARGSAPVAAPREGVWAFGAPEDAVQGWLPPVRSTARLNRLPLLAAMASQLERLRSEG
ncbi:MAG: tRNA (guanosine(37)-N1)-methyltransferase TrmD [Deltaproteobacteria bacterium]